MWRWWIAAGLVVMALGVVAMAVASYSDNSIPCIDRLAYEDGHRWFGDELVGEEFHRRFSSRLDVDSGETAWLTATVQNVSRSYRQGLHLGPMPPTRFAVATPDCRLVWSSSHSFFSPSFMDTFGPHEAKGSPVSGIS